MNIGYPHQKRIDFSPEITGEQAYQNSDECLNQNRPTSNDERNPQAINHGAQKTSALNVGP